MAKIKNILLKYENKWVALSEDQEKVLESAESLLELQNKIKKQNKRNLVVTKVMPFDTYLVPHVKASD